MRFIDRAGQPYRAEAKECAACQRQCVDDETLEMLERVKGNEAPLPEKVFRITSGIYEGLFICAPCTGYWGKAEVKNQ